MYNFYNYSHSLLILMLWILPINLPVLVVWIRNLALHWLTPFSSHHNILSIVPFILLVETGATGKMVPPMNSRLRHITGMILLSLALYSAAYGVSYAYTLHQVANVFCAWLVLILWFTGSWELEKVIGKVVSSKDDPRNKKRP
jgi:glycosylphosphatidylinositol deacylase